MTSCSYGYNKHDHFSLYLSLERVGNCLKVSAKTLLGMYIESLHIQPAGFDRPSTFESA